MRKGPPPIVEFAGLPGSGKTTVAEELRELLATSGVECASRGELAADGAGFLRRQMRRGWLILRQSPRAAGHYAWLAGFVRRSGQSRRADAFKVFWNLCTVVALITQHRARARGVMILDQGIVQAVWSVGIGAARERRGTEAWREVLIRIGASDIGFVLLRVPAETARRRVAGRPAQGSRMERAEWAAEPALWARAERLCGSLAAAIAQLESAGAPDGPAALVALDGAAAGSGALAAEIRSRLFGDATPPEPDVRCRAWKA